MAAVRKELTGAAKGRRTQWAAQFLAAAELVRRDYTVSFTMGNSTPVADLMVGTHGGEQFWVDVKGLSDRRDWLLKPKPEHVGLFYILVHLRPLAGPGAERAPDRFYVLSQGEANQLVSAYQAAHPNAKTTIAGFSFAAAEPYRDRWDMLPSIG